MMHREARPSTTLAGTRMIDGERAQTGGLHRVRGGLELSAARAPLTHT